jgi:hypothetical protein
MNGDGFAGPVVADGHNVYTVNSGWSCPNNNNNGNGGSSGCGNPGQVCCYNSGNGVGSCNNGVGCNGGGGTCSQGDGGLGLAVVGVLTGGATVVAFPITSGPPAVLATSGDGSPVIGVAVDSSHVYWVTSSTAWSIPVGGGTPLAIAGNLGGSVVPCAFSSGTAASTQVSIASDGTYVYIGSPAKNAIYRVPVPSH